MSIGDAAGEMQSQWLGRVVTFGLAALAAGLAAIFLWVVRQRDVEERMPEFIGLMLLAGIL